MDKKEIERLLLVKNTKTPEKDDSGRLIYEAFDAKDKTKYLQIRTARGIHRAPAYAYLLDVIHNGEQGTEIALLFSFMAVELRGKNLENVALSLINRTCAYVQEFDAGKFAPPPPEAPVIESMEITGRE